MDETKAKTILSCEFEVYGIVQGVSFRKFTQNKAKELHIHGWCMNTKNDTVKGEIQGIESAFKDMKHWLQHTGSPTSRIDKCVFGTVQELPAFTYDEFSIRQ